MHPIAIIELLTRLLNVYEQREAGRRERAFGSLVPAPVPPHRTVGSGPAEAGDHPLYKVRATNLFRCRTGPGNYCREAHNQIPITMVDNEQCGALVRTTNRCTRQLIGGQMLCPAITGRQYSNSQQ